MKAFRSLPQHAVSELIGLDRNLAHSRGRARLHGCSCLLSPSLSVLVCLRVYVSHCMKLRGGHERLLITAAPSVRAGTANFALSSIFLSVRTHVVIFRRRTPNSKILSRGGHHLDFLFMGRGEGERRRRLPDVREKVCGKASS